MSKKSPKVYFPGLNALRFFAAFAVILTHVELMKKYIGFNNVWRDIWSHQLYPTVMPAMSIAQGQMEWYQPIVAEAGPLGVVFFFVLSGFLITYLLFVEKENKGGIAVKAFYARRIFRIWPLYYLIFILGFFMLPQFDVFHVPHQQAALEDHFWVNFWCYLIILPNLALSIFNEEAGAVPNIGQSWSIGVEEQFYLIWPWLMRMFKKPLIMMIGFTIILLMLKVMVLFLWKANPSATITVIKNFLVMSKIECMTIGGIGAYFSHRKKAGTLKIIYKKGVQLIALLGIPALVYCTHILFQDGVHLVYAVLFLIIIMNVSSNPTSLVKLENKVLGFLGKVSYGVYMYHIIVIVLLLNIAKQMEAPRDFFDGLNGWILFILVGALTVLLSHLSYKFFEKPFIKLKSKFTRVISGEEAKEG